MLQILFMFIVRQSKPQEMILCHWCTWHVADEAKVDLSSPKALTVGDGDMIDISCSTSVGYPAPNVLLYLDNIRGTVTQVSWHTIEWVSHNWVTHMAPLVVFRVTWTALVDARWPVIYLLPLNWTGTESRSRASKYSTDFQTSRRALYCTFPVRRLEQLLPVRLFTFRFVVRLVLKINKMLSVLDLTYKKSCPSVIKKSLTDGQAFDFNLSQYIVNASPNQFDINCAMNNTVMFAAYNKTKDNLNIRLLFTGDYRCVISHKAFSRSIDVHLTRSTNTKTGKDTLIFLSASLCYWCSVTLQTAKP